SFVTMAITMKRMVLSWIRLGLIAASFAASFIRRTRPVKIDTVVQKAVICSGSTYLSDEPTLSPSAAGVLGGHLASSLQVEDCYAESDWPTAQDRYDNFHR